MKRTIRHRIKRWWKRRIIKCKRMFGADKRPTFPKKATENEKTVAEIFLNLLHDPKTKLYYNRATQEAFLRSYDNKLFIFLQAQNVKVINATGYDHKISNEMEAYLSERFDREQNKRRNEFIDEAMGVVKESLDKTLEKLNK